MTYYTQTHRQSIGERVLTGAAHIFEKAAARYAHYRIYRDSLDELRELSTRDLDDLGLNRSTLKEVALATADQQVKL